MKTYINTVNIHPFIRLPKVLVFIRHAESLGNAISWDERAAHKIPNHAYPITERGIQQAKEAGKIMESIFGKDFFDLTFHSSFKRTQETLRIILDESEVGENPIEDSRLDEKWNGLFHDLSYEEIQTRHPDQLMFSGRTGFYHFRSLGGESVPDVEARIRSFLNDLEKVKKEKVLIACHGSWLLVMRKLLEGWSVDEFISRRAHDPVSNCGIYIYKEENGKYTLDIKTVSIHKASVREEKSEFA